MRFTFFVIVALRQLLSAVIAITEDPMRRFATIVLLASLAVLAVLLLPAHHAAAAPSNAPQLQSSGVHVVRAGENLSGIARRYGVSMATLAQANGISNPNFIYAGQRLTIPGASGGSAAGGAATSGGVHVVRRGESLGAIAARYGTSVAALTRANNIRNPNLIYAGQRLVIPGAGGAASGGGAAPQPAPAPGGGGRWIDINLSSQQLTAYEGGAAVFSTAVSTGLYPTPTPAGTYRIL
jgi:LysM repeat protein